MSLRGNVICIGKDLGFDRETYTIKITILFFYLCIGSPAPRSCGLKTSRRNPKRPKQSPMAMVKPLVHRPPTLLDDEIFLVDVVDPPERSMESLLEIDRKNSLPDRPTNSAKQTPHLGKFGSNDEKKWRRHEDTAKRKRNSISMLG